MGQNFGNFMNDPTTQMMGQFGKTAYTAGQEYVEQNVGLLISWRDDMGRS
jgi:protein transport protein YIF1